MQVSSASAIPLSDSGAVTMIQRLGSAANLNIHLHCLVLDGVYQLSADGAPEFVEAPAPTTEALQTVLHKIITRLIKPARLPVARCCTQPEHS